MQVMTLSHCRFEMQAVHGIDEVLVVDADEFLFCNQREYVLCNAMLCYAILSTLLLFCNQRESRN
jgi:hypothetical protein